MSINKREVRRQVYAVLIAKLRSESLVDEDDPEFIDVAWAIQLEIANRIEKKAALLSASPSTAGVGE